MSDSNNTSMFMVMFYLPIYLQSIHGLSAVASGVDTLPFLAFFALGAFVGGAAVGKTRLLQPYQLVGAIFTTAGMGVFYSLGVSSSRALYFGAQILFGFGIGLSNQIPVIAAQGFSAPGDIASLSGIMVCKCRLALSNPN